jgi:phenylacetate-CoA ligase
VITTRLPLDDPRLLHSRSSGTSGDRLETVSSKLDLSRRVVEGLVANPSLAAAMRAGIGSGVRYAPPNCSEVECANLSLDRADRTLDNGVVVLPVGHDLLATPAPLVEQAMRELEEDRPLYLDVDATHLAFLLRRYRQSGWPPPPATLVTLSYTMPPRAARRQVTEAYPDACIAAVVMMTEFGWVAVECEHGSLHLNTRSYLPELLRDREPIAPGEMGELVLTGLHDRVLPHIRYRTGDVYRLDRACPCGNRGGYPAVTFEGRIRQMIVRDRRVLLTPGGLDELVGAPAWLDCYRMAQVSESHLRFQYVAGGVTGTGPAELEERLHAVLDPCRLDLEAVHHIPTDRTGKFLSCRSEVAPTTAIEGFL